jgi:hypothetical protein
VEAVFFTNNNSCLLFLVLSSFWFLFLSNVYFAAASTYIVERTVVGRPPLKCWTTTHMCVYITVCLNGRVTRVNIM